MIHFTGGRVYAGLRAADMTNFNQMSDFIDMNELPLVIDYKDKVVSVFLGGKVGNEQTAREIFESKRITNQLILFYNASEPGFDDALNEFYLVAKETLGRTYCLKAAIEDNERLMRHFGVQWTPTRSFVVHVPPVSTFQRRTTRWRTACRGNICFLASWCRRTFSGSWRRRCASTTR